MLKQLIAFVIQTNKYCQYDKLLSYFDTMICYFNKLIVDLIRPVCYFKILHLHKRKTDWKKCSIKI